MENLLKKKYVKDEKVLLFQKQGTWNKYLKLLKLKCMMCLAIDDTKSAYWGGKKQEMNYIWHLLVYNNSKICYPKKYRSIA